MKTACVQFESADTGSAAENVRRNLAKAGRIIRDAAESGTELLVFPEIFPTGYIPETLNSTPYEELERLYRHSDTFLAGAAQNTGVTIASGICEAAGGKLYNSLKVYAADGSSPAAYRKLNLFPRSAEPAVFERGADVPTFRLNGFTIGLLICYDIRFPELSRRFVDAGCSLIIVSSAFPRSRVFHWRTLLAARAIENQMYIAAADHSGTFGRASFAGHSMILDPSGTVLAESGEDGEETVQADISPKVVEEFRDRFPFHADRTALIDALTTADNPTRQRGKDMTARPDGRHDEKLSFIFERRSIRKYSDRHIEDEVITSLLKAAMSAPSAVARDPWRFIVVKDRGMLGKLSEALPNGKMLPSADTGIVVCADTAAAPEDALGYLVQDCSAAVENMLLAAHALGLGACWLGVHPRKEREAHIRTQLGIPEDVLPVAVVALGYPVETKAPRSRYDGEKVRYERWS